jgi:hypothetical protein
MKEKNYRLSMVVFLVMHEGRLRYKTGSGQKHKSIPEK